MANQRQGKNKRKYCIGDIRILSQNVGFHKKPHVESKLLRGVYKNYEKYEKDILKLHQKLEQENKKLKETFEEQKDLKEKCVVKQENIKHLKEMTDMYCRSIESFKRKLWDQKTLENQHNFLQREERFLKHNNTKLEKEVYRLRKCFYEQQTLWKTIKREEMSVKNLKQEATNFQQLLREMEDASQQKRTLPGESPDHSVGEILSQPESSSTDAEHKIPKDKSQKLGKKFRGKELDDSRLKRENQALRAELEKLQTVSKTKEDEKDRDIYALTAELIQLQTDSKTKEDEKNREIQALRAKLLKLQTDEDGKDREIQALRAKLEKLQTVSKTKEDEKNREIQALRAKLLKLQTVRQTDEDEKERKIQALRAKLLKLQTVRKTDEDEKDREIQALRGKLLKLQTARKTDEDEKDREIQALRAKLLKLHTDEDEKERKIQALRAKLLKLQTVRQTDEDEKDREIQALREEVQKLQTAERKNRAEKDRELKALKEQNLLLKCINHQKKVELEQTSSEEGNDEHSRKKTALFSNIAQSFSRKFQNVRMNWKKSTGGKAKAAQKEDDSKMEKDRHRSRVFQNRRHCKGSSQTTQHDGESDNFSEESQEMQRSVTDSENEFDEILNESLSGSSFQISEKSNEDGRSENTSVDENSFSEEEQEQDSSQEEISESESEISQDDEASEDPSRSSNPSASYASESSGPNPKISPKSLQRNVKTNNSVRQNRGLPQTGNSWQALFNSIKNNLSDDDGTFRQQRDTKGRARTIMVDSFQDSSSS